MPAQDQPGLSNAGSSSRQTIRSAASAASLADSSGISSTADIHHGSLTPRASSVAGDQHGPPFDAMSWASGTLSTPYRRPQLSRQTSGPSPYAANFTSSLPTAGWGGPPRRTTAAVPPQSDYLANWETLQDLIDDTPDGEGPSSSRSRASHRPSRHRGPQATDRSATTPTPARPIAAPPPASIPGVEEVDEPGSPVAADILSASPPTFDEPMPSLSTAAEALGSPDLPPEALEESSHCVTPTTPAEPSRPPQAPVESPAPPKQPAAKRWSLPPYATPIFKCALSYLIASLFTFVPQLSDMLSMQTETDAHGRVHPKPAYSAHMVATIVVYFNPAKSLGNMNLSTRYCFILATMAALLCLLSIGIIHVFDYYSPSEGKKWDWVSELGDWVVCILCVGGGMGGLAWAKLWVGNPSFNTGCSMAAVTLFTVIVKEGGWIKLKEVLLIVVIGAVITNVVCYTIFPVSATTKLQSSMSKSLRSFSTLLDLLTSTFILEKPFHKNERMSLADAVKSHGAAFSSLKAALAEAKHERLIDPRVRGDKLELYDAAIGSMARLAQHLAAMRGSTRMQEALMRANREGRIVLDANEKYRNPRVSQSILGELHDIPTIHVEHEADVAGSVNVFLQLQKLTGESLDTLVARCDDALDGIEDVITDKEHADLQCLRIAVADSLRDFSTAASRAIKHVYAGPQRRPGLYANEEDGDDDDEVPLVDVSGIEEEGPNEVVFLVYFFLFTLEEFARELLFLLDTANDIIDAPRLSAMAQLRTLIAPWKQRQKRNTNFLYKQFQKLVPIDPSKLQPPLFPRNVRDKPGTVLTPGRQGLSFREKVYHWFWQLGARLREPDMRYAIKTGLAGAMLAAPAYVERTRPIFLEYRGEWALIAFFATMSPTLGQTNFLSFFRIVGTLLGGVVAVIAYSLFPENAIILPIFGFFFSMPCFYIITQMPNYAQAGRFILLTYNLTCLYAYNLREKDLSAVEIAYRRTTGVSVGVIWAAIVSRWWWPYTARRELRMGLGDFCLDLSYLYSKLVTTYTRGVESLAPDGEASDESDPLLPHRTTRHHLEPGVRQFMAMELHLQHQLGTLRGLLAHAKNEPRIKGPFPFDFYHEVLLSCERMLDRLHSMRCVTTRQDWDQSIRQAFVLPVNHLQREMAGNVILYYYTLSAGFRLRIPMPPYLPSAEPARERLVEAIRDLDVVKQRSVRGGGRHLLFFAYALAMQEMIGELDYLGGLLQDAFGVISQSTVRDFEELFVGGAPESSEFQHVRHMALEDSQEL